MRESSLELALVRHVADLGGRAYKFSSPSQRGVPDRLVVLPSGRVIFVELKAPTKKPTRLQQHIHGQLRALGHTVLVIDSLEEISHVA